MRQRKYTGCLRIVVLLIVVSTMACGAAASSVPVLTLEECIRQALADHPQLRIAEYNLMDAKAELQKLQLEDPSLVAARDLAAREAAVAEAGKGLDEAGMQLSLRIEGKYYQVLKAIQTVESQESSLDWIRRQLGIAEVKYRQGMVPQRDYLALQEQLTQTEHAVEYARFNLDTVKMDFNLTMGWELNRSFELAEKQFPFESVEVNLEEAVQYALANGTQVREAEDMLRSAVAVLEMKQYGGMSRLEIDQAERNVEKAKMQLDTVQKEMLIAVRSGYIGLLSGRDGVLNAQKAYEQAEKNLEVLKVKYEAGMIPLLDLINGHNELLEKEVQWIQAVYDYNLTKASFYQTIGKGYSRYQQIKETIRK